MIINLHALFFPLLILISYVPSLRVENFKGTPPAGAFQSAYTECDYGFIFDNGRIRIPIKVYCIFKQDKSWIQPIVIKAADPSVLKNLLIHEEGHYKNSLIAAKKLQTAMFQVNYNNPSIGAPRVQQIKHQIDQEAIGQNKKYESETRNGRDRNAQNEWNILFSSTS